MIIEILISKLFFKESLDIIGCDDLIPSEINYLLTNRPFSDK